MYCVLYFLCFFCVFIFFFFFKQKTAYEILAWLEFRRVLFRSPCNQSIQFWSGFIPINGGGGIYPTLTATSPTPTLHLAQFKASSFSKPTLLLSFSTCVFHFFFGRPCFLLPFTSDSNAFLKTCPSSLNTCPNHLTPFTFAIWTTVSLHSVIFKKSSLTQWSEIIISMYCSGITDQGLYRVVGVGSKVQNLVFQCIEKKKVHDVNLEESSSEWEVKTITSGLKQYLR